MSNRTTSVDLIRLLALVGICLVNVPYLGLTLGLQVDPTPQFMDNLVAFLVHAFFEAKFFLLFSFLFGWGMHIQAASANRHGVAFAKRYFRRIGGLAVIGVLHGIFVFTGDILLLYACLGLILWPMRNLAARTLVMTAFCMVPLAMILLAMLASLPLHDLAVPPSGPGLGGSFLQATEARLSTWPGDFLFLVIFQGPLAFGAFLLGLAAAKTGFFQTNSSGRLWLTKAFPWLLILALPLNLAYASAMLQAEFGEMSLGMFAAFVSIAIAAPLLSACYLFCMLELSERLSLPTLLENAGRNSLTVYILQGVLAGLVFGGYGLGLHDSLTRSELLPLSLAIAIVAIVITGLLARMLGRGPFEILLRAATYHGSKAD